MPNNKESHDAPFARAAATRGRFGVTQTRADVNALLHYGHFIPVRRGLTAKYVDGHFPGWTWNGLSAVLKAARVVARSSTGTLCCDPAVTAVHFDAAHSWLVEWEDGRVTQSETRHRLDAQS